jgi:hypothetical protein
MYLLLLPYLTLMFCAAVFGRYPSRWVSGSDGAPEATYMSRGLIENSPAYEVLRVSLHGNVSLVLAPKKVFVYLSPPPARGMCKMRVPALCFF